MTEPNSSEPSTTASDLSTQSPPTGADAPAPNADVSAPAPAPAPQPGAFLAKSPIGYAFLGGVALLTLIADLGTKFWAEKTLVLPGPLGTPSPQQVIKGFFGFTLAKNHGGAWGLLQHTDESIRMPFFIIVSVAAIAFIVSLYRRVQPDQWALRWGLPLVLGGALGNLIDRIRYTYVIDFIDVQMSWGGEAHHWPTFNVADIAICVGVGLMAVDMLTGRKDVHHAPPASPADPNATLGEKPESRPVS